MRQHLKERLSRFVSRAIAFLFTPLWCDHQWGKARAEEHGEKYRYRITIRCLKCGRTESYPD